ncbi:MAG: NADH-quinone oxidoreductase subunit N [Chloroflexota bacterium]|nr:NADH-quinone oxidoreductase subunit N [Chloroflexota bacterium]MDE2961160.1 NADH-quinone oxidoreductase subunit N [Chloroflexota bacterium]
MPTELTSNLHLLTPEFVLTALAFLVFTVDLFLPERHKEWLAGLSVVSLIAVMVIALVMRPAGSVELYGGLIVIDSFGLFFKIFFLAIGVGIIALSVEYGRDRLEHRGEFYGLLLFSILGMNLMAMSRELLTAYIALELLSFSLYVMVAYGLREARSNEAGIKYIIIGALSSAIMLYGLSNIYAALGTTFFAGIAEELASPGTVSPVLWVGVALLVVGLGFKLSAVPFHMWAPDAYEGAPLPVTAYLAIGSKAAAFALTLRLFAEAIAPAAARWDEWQLVIAVLAAITMLLGNLVALAQRNLKRLMAYSSIGHVGYALAGIAVLGSDFALAAKSVVFYLVVYAVTNLVVFAGITAYYNRTGQDNIADLAGLADRQPFVAAAIAIGLFSLAGLPIFAGFTAKFYLFAAVADGGFLWLAGVAIFASLISLYYYLQVLRQMYIERPANPGHEVYEHAPAEDHGEAHGHGDHDEPPVAPMPRPSLLLTATMGVGLLVVTWLGVYPAPLLSLIDAASAAIVPQG